MQSQQPQQVRQDEAKGYRWKHDRIVIDIKRNQEDEFAKREIRKDVLAKVQDRTYKGHDHGSIGKIIDDRGYEATWRLKGVNNEIRPQI